MTSPADITDTWKATDAQGAELRVSVHANGTICFSVVGGVAALDEDQIHALLAFLEERA